MRLNVAYGQNLFIYFNLGESTKTDLTSIVTTMNATIPLGATAVHCLAPWWNSTSYLTSSRRFETISIFS